MSRLASVVVFAAFVAGCSKCGSSASSTVPVERVLPRSALGLVVVPSIDTLGQKLKLLEGLKVASFLAPTQGFANSKAFADALVNELGIDVRSHEALENAGIDGARPLGAAVLVSGQAYLAVPVKDAAKFDTFFATLAKKRLGAPVVTDDASAGAKVKRYSASVGASVRAGYVLTQQFALVATKEGVNKLADLAALSQADSLSADAGLTKQLARVAANRDVFVYLPAGSQLLARTPIASFVGALGLEAGALRLTADGVWKGDPSQLAMFAPAPSAVDLTGYLPADAFVVGRYQGDPMALASSTGSLLGPHLNRAFSEAGFDVKSEVLARLQPGMTASLSLADRPPLGQGLPTIDPRKTNPFAFAHLAGAAQTKPGEDAVAVLKKLADLAPKFGAEMKFAERDGIPAFLTTYSQGEGVHLAVKPQQGLVFFASPLPRLEALVKSDGKRANQGPRAEALEKGDAADVVLDLRRLSQSVRALPESAWGIGGFAMKATTVRWLDATDDLLSIAAGVGSKESAIQAHLTLFLATAATEPAKAP